MLLCGLGIRIERTFALWCVVRGEHLWDMKCPIPPAYCMLGILAYSEAYEFGQLVLGCPGAGNILFQVRMSSLKKKNQRHL